MDNLIELTVKGFRAIGNAKIALNGITVVSGINGSGKSTLSRILYYIFKNANDFDHLVAVYLFNQIKPYINAFEQLVDCSTLNVPLISLSNVPGISE